MKKRDIAIEILETLKEQGIDLSKIKTKIKSDGQTRRILLKEMNIDGIDEFIKKYNWNPNFPIGNQIDVMRGSKKYKNAEINDRIKALNIERSTNNVKDVLEETILNLERLKAEGVDVELIKQKINFRYTYLREIDSPITDEIMRKLNLDGDYPIGKRISMLIAKYSDKKCNAYTSEKRQRVKNLGIIDSYEEQIFQSLDVLKKLKEEGVDLSSAYDIVVDEKGKQRRKYICELDNPNIEEIIKKLNLPRFYLIGYRIGQIRTYIFSKTYPIEIRKKIKEELVTLGLSCRSDEEILREALDIISKLKDYGVVIEKIFLHQTNNRAYKKLEDLEFDNKEEFFNKYGFDKNYKFGRALSRLYNIAKDEKILERYNLTQEEKEMIRTLYQNRLNELKNNSISKTLRLIQMLENFDIDLNNYPLKPYVNGTQISLKLCDLPLTDEQLQDIENELGYKPDFNIGNRIINIKSSIEGNGRLSFSNEQLEEMLRLKIFETKRHKFEQKQNPNDKKIEFFKALRDADIELSRLKLTYTLNGKSLPVSLGMLNIREEKLNEIKQKFNVDENFKFLNWFSNLKRDYRRGFLTSEQEESLENLGIISKLDRLDARQRKLQSKLDRANKLERQVDSEIDKRDDNNIE